MSVSPNTKRTCSTILTKKNGIEWYYEQEGSGPHIVLIPDGLGDCELFRHAITPIAECGFTVTTFDMPGLSRSNKAPPVTYQDVTAEKLADYVMSLMDALHIDKATFWGCSSGGSTVLGIVAKYSPRVRSALVHEVPKHAHDLPSEQDALTDEDILRDTPGKMLAISGDEQAWAALGPVVHGRLMKNYVPWVRGYVRTIPASTPVDGETLARCHLDWSVGWSTPTGRFFDNIFTATGAGLSLSTLSGMHFPYVSHPDVFAAYVVEKTKKYM